MEGYERQVIHADDKDMITVFIKDIMAVELRFQRHGGVVTSTVIMLGATSGVADVPSVVLYDKNIVRPTLVRSRTRLGY